MDNTQDLKSQVSQFFQIIYKLGMDSRIPAIMGDTLPQAELRAQEFALADPKHIIVEARTSALYSQVAATIYEARVSKLAAVFALFDSSQLLWLDNHYNNDDFTEFINRESLQLWLPNRLSEIANLITNTKLWFFNRPQLVSSVIDIPKIPREERDCYIQHEQQDILHKNDQRMATVGDKIEPPNLSINSGGTAQLNFCIWTEVFGSIYKVRCTLASNGMFDYEGEKLINGVGDYFIPRA